MGACLFLIEIEQARVLNGWGGREDLAGIGGGKPYPKYIVWEICFQIKNEDYYHGEGEGILGTERILRKIYPELRKGTFLLVSLPQWHKSTQSRKHAMFSVLLTAPCVRKIAPVCRKELDKWFCLTGVSYVTSLLARVLYLGLDQ